MVQTTISEGTIPIKYKYDVEQTFTLLKPDNENWPFVTLRTSDFSVGSFLCCKTNVLLPDIYVGIEIGKLENERPWLSNSLLVIYPLNIHRIYYSSPLCTEFIQECLLKRNLFIEEINKQKSDLVSNFNNIFSTSYSTYINGNGNNLAQNIFKILNLSYTNICTNH